MTRELLDRFNGWFSSSAGVWQTAVIACGIAAVELADPRLDPHGFWLLWALTIYSGITQPALAYSARVGAEQNEAIETRLVRLEEEHGAILKAICERVGAA